MGKLTQIYTWTAANTTDVAKLQTTAGAGSLLINGNLVKGRDSFVSFGNVSRTVSLTSAGNNAAVNVTIFGMYNGVATSATISGPNANTVYTTGHEFDTVTGVSVDAAVTAMSVGSGTTGNTQFAPFDWYRPYPAMSVQVAVTGTINYSFVTTLDDASLAYPTSFNTGLVIPNPGSVNAFQTVMSSATASAFAYFSYPVQWVSVLVNSSDTTGSLVVKLIQQGIR